VPGNRRHGERTVIRSENESAKNPRLRGDNADSLAAI
jgi:hypothetical protein